jgi:dTMP kinase
LHEHLNRQGWETVFTEEPGGTTIGRKIRELLLSLEYREISNMTELLLYNASRAQHIHEVIIPALNRGAIVITDRFSDSTIAYQGYGRGFDLELIHSLDIIATGGLRPDVTILLDVDVETGLNRNREVNKTDRLELENTGFHRKVQKGYHEIAAREPGRMHLLDASGSIETLFKKISLILNDFIEKHMNRKK